MRFITNFSAHQLAIYQRAIKMYAVLDKTRTLTIKLESYDSLGRFYEGSLSLHASGPQDLSDFWSTFELVKNKYREVYDGTKLLCAGLPN